MRELFILAPSHAEGGEVKTRIIGGRTLVGLATNLNKKSFIGKIRGFIFLKGLSEAQTGI